MNDDLTPPGTLRLSEDEEKMRRALGLLPGGSAPQQRPHTSAPQQAPDMHRGHFKRRFVSDGEVPVTVIPATNRRPNEDAERYHAERHAREQAERSLHEAQNTMRDLQTKLGHAGIAMNEAQQSLAAERQKTAELTAQLNEARHRIQTLEEAAEQRARRAEATRQARAAEKAERERLAAEAAEAEASAAAAKAAARNAAPKVVTRTVAKAPARAFAKSEPRPVKWWLSAPKKKASAKPAPAHRGRAAR